MKLDLLLNRTSHEQSGVSGDVAFNGWLHGPSSGTGSGNGLLPLISLREEAWGGVFVYGPTGQVFAADNEAFALLTELKTANSLEALKAQYQGDLGDFIHILAENRIKV